MASTRDVFDPFTPTDWQENGQSRHEGDPWSSDTWGNSLDFQMTSIDTSFDSAALFDLQPAPSSDFLADEASTTFFPEFAELSFDQAHDEDNNKNPTIQVAIHEQLSCLYDGRSSSGRVDGSIHVRPPVYGTTEPFSLLIRDAEGHIETMNENAAVCQNITATAPESLEKAEDRAFRVLIPLGFNPMCPIARYRCSSEVYPIPLLVKSKVNVIKNVCRVQLKIRANPANRFKISDVAVILAVPPTISGESAKMSQEGGVWDGMKRLVAWSLSDTIDPGQLLEMHVQFRFVVEEANRTTPKFPILVRGTVFDELYSGISLSATHAYDLTVPASMNVSRSVRFLHRKV